FTRRLSTSTNDRIDLCTSHACKIHCKPQEPCSQPRHPLNAYLHTAIVERLCGECTLLLTNSDDVPLLSSGNQHFQRLLGYSIVRIRARRSWSELVSDVYVRTVAMCLTVAALIVAVELGT
ncbi:MAG: hypothetical protein ACLP22_20395, partial [Solirubrobacteraceae bacterium]